jgi:LmbE family N-acetylglucosaminyl deacetylase
MLRFGLADAKRILCVGAHSDDIEIGCGGTILKLLRDHPGVDVQWVVFSGSGSRAEEARRSAELFLGAAAARTIVVEQFEDTLFPSAGPAIKASFERLKSFRPDVVFTHYRDDRHQDHRVLSDLAWNTFRNHLILEYEIPKYDGDLGIPNVFVPLEEDVVARKVELLCEVFQTQGNRHWFSEDTFRALMRLRGIECASDSKYAEAFHCRKLTLG